VDPIPDPLLLRKSGSAGNRTRDLWVCSQEVWILDHSCSPINPIEIDNEQVNQIWGADALTEVLIMSDNIIPSGIIISLIPGGLSFQQLQYHLSNCFNICQQVVYITRNPKDMCVSYYHYCTLVHNMKGSFEDFCELFLKGRGKTPFWDSLHVNCETLVEAYIAMKNRRNQELKQLRG
jgi:hypothetical protein